MLLRTAAHEPTSTADMHRHAATDGGTPVDAAITERISSHPTHSSLRPSDVRLAATFPLWPCGTASDFTENGVRIVASLYVLFVQEHVVRLQPRILGFVATDLLRSAQTLLRGMRNEAVGVLLTFVIGFLAGSLIAP